MVVLNRALRRRDEAIEAAQRKEDAPDVKGWR
jgi:hypothetical protein